MGATCGAQLFLKYSAVDGIMSALLCVVSLTTLGLRCYSEWAPQLSGAPFNFAGHKNANDGFELKKR